ncbi:uncharacterized protein LOC111059054 isoform X2 [Nilaparvata lugens]|uniref:uncharacterized protein LOC111059054 isoform X2 n=1 Tax=Nilaparvata lugens TaxID=108931 RepID=UPI00193E2DA6|nr:uncharacterized protein LOC111059054 isoform X2 [Nilaparvata lugens]
MSLPRKVVHHGCCGNFYLSIQKKKYQTLFKRCRKIERAYKTLSNRYNDLKSQNTAIVRELQEQKVLNRRLENELHSRNSVWMNHATSIEHAQMKQLLGSMDMAFENMLTHTVELTKFMSDGKSALDNYRFLMRNNWASNNRPMTSTNNDVRKPTSKTAPIRPMVQGFTVHQPSIFLQRCNVPTLEEEMTINNQMENDDSDRLPTIFEASNSDADSSPGTANMMQDIVQDSINFENARKRKSRLGRFGFRSSNCGETLFRGNSRSEANSNQEELQDSTDNFSPVRDMNDVINIRRRNVSRAGTATSNLRRNAAASLSHSEREPVVKLHKLDHDRLASVSHNQPCPQIIEELSESVGDDEEELTSPRVRVRRELHPVERRRAESEVVDPLEGSSWMFCNNNTPVQKSTPRVIKVLNVTAKDSNMSIIVDDDDDDDDDIIEASPASNANVTRNNIIKQPKPNNMSTTSATATKDFKSCLVVCEKIIDPDSDCEIVRPLAEESSNQSNNSNPFSGFDSLEVKSRENLNAMNRVINDIVQEATPNQNQITDTNGIDVVYFDESLDAQNVKSEVLDPRSPEKRGNHETIDVDNETGVVGNVTSEVNDIVSNDNDISNDDNIVSSDNNVVSDDTNAPQIRETSRRNRNLTATKNSAKNTTGARQRSPTKAVVQTSPAKPVENANSPTGRPSIEEDNIPIITLKNKLSHVSPRKRSAKNHGDRLANEDMSKNGSSTSGVESEQVDCVPEIAVDCSSITKRRKMRCTPTSSSKNESNRQSNCRETPSESMKKKISQESSQDHSTVSSFDEFGFLREERSRRNRVVQSYKEVSLGKKLRRSK